MKNKILFTQDILDERSWLESKFPGYGNLETVHAGRWPNTEPNLIKDSSYLLEIPESDKINIHSEFQSDTYVSLFNKQYPQTKWVYADHLISNEEFPIFSDIGNSQYQVITFGRVGTVFVESLLDKTLTKLSDHTAVKDKELNQSIIDLINQFPGTYVVLTYRSDWWAWLTSMLLSRRYGFFHYNDTIDWSTVDPITISKDDILRHEQQVFASWNFFFEVRTSCPSHSFYLLEFSNMLAKYQKDTTHQAMPYDKTKLITNYDQAEQMFKQEFLSRWQQWEHRAVKHLKAMSVRTDIDNLF